MLTGPQLLLQHCLLLTDCRSHAVQVSYMILQRVTPVTHSVGNCLKRVIVIVASVIVFQNPMSQKNMIGELPSAALLAADGLLSSFPLGTVRVAVATFHFVMLYQWSLSLTSVAVL